MTAPVPSGPTTRAPGQARDLQAQLYRDIGISAVAAALRCTTLPAPDRQPAVTEPTPVKARRSTLAA